MNDNVIFPLKKIFTFRIFRQYSSQYHQLTTVQKVNFCYSEARCGGVVFLPRVGSPFNTFRFSSKTFSANSYISV